MRFLGRYAHVLAVPLLLASFGIVASVPALPVHAISAWHAGRSSVLGAPQRVTRSQAAASSASRVSPPHHVKNRTAYQPAASGASAIRTVAPTSSASGRAPQQAQPLTNGFALMSRDQQAAAFPSQASIEPPDTMVAAGTVNLLEMVNETGSVWDKGTGNAVGTAFDLNAYPFAVPTGFLITDPRVLFDASTSTWIATATAFKIATTPYGFEAYIATTTGTDPGTSTWIKHVIYTSTTDLCDQPKLGMSDDKLVVACDLYNGTRFDGADIIVLSRSQIEAGQAGSRVSTFGPNTSAFSVVPAVSQSATTTAFMAYNLGQQPNAPTPNLGVVAAIGDPTIDQNLAGGVHVDEIDASITPTTVPPLAPQAGTTCNPSVAPPDGCIETNDDRLLSATWKDGMLWTAGNDGCVPQGDATTRACLRLFRIDTTQWPGVTVELDGDIGLAGSYLYYPAVTLDAFDNAVIAYSQSSTTMYPSAVAVDFLTSFGALGTAVPIVAGAAPYPNPGVRWGDYSSAVPDPQNPADIWVAGEYSASGNADNWGTGARRLAVQPMITDLTPTTGPPAGGQTVIIHGNYFQSGATVMFGSTPAATATTIDSSTIQATTPPGTLGTTVAVSVHNPDGSVSGSSFTYVYLTGIYTLDGYGGIHPDGGSTPMSGAPYWAGWKIARSSVMLADGSGGYVLDGYGGIHAFGSAPTPLMRDAPYFGFDIARDIVLLPGSSSGGARGYVLDGWGGLHPFHAGGLALPLAATATPYWKNWDIAKRVVLLGSGDGGFVLDGWGGLHPFGIGLSAAPTLDPNHAYWPNWNIARDLVLLPGSTATSAPGLVLDGYGGLHPFNFGGAVTGAAYFAGNDFALAVRVSPAATTGNLQGWVMDAWGGLHAFGGAGPISPSAYWPNWRIAAQLMVQ
jgi:IPT/TIG domain-containing protein